MKRGSLFPPFFFFCQNDNVYLGYSKTTMTGVKSRRRIGLSTLLARGKMNEMTDRKNERKNERMNNYRNELINGKKKNPNELNERRKE